MEHQRDLAFPILKPRLVPSIIVELPAQLPTASPLSQHEQDKARRMSNPTFKHRFVWGRTLLRGWLGQCIKCAPHDVPLRMLRGRPVLCGYPIAFNIAHGSGHVMIALTMAGLVGVDLEANKPVPDPTSIARLVMSKPEIHHLNQLSGDAQQNEFLRLWVRREAWLKYGGRGFAGNTRTTDCQGLQPDTIAKDGTVAQHSWCVVARQDMDITDPQKLTVPMRKIGAI